MYENITYESILQDMLDRLPNTIDKREGSIIYDALAPAALKLAEAYFTLDNNLDLVFLDTAVGEYLTRKCLEYGVDRKEATYAIRKAEFRDENNNLLDIEIGSRFGIEDIALQAIERISLGVFKLQCEQSGIIGNGYIGNSLIPIDNIPRLGTATLGEILIYGEDTESDESLRARTKTAIANSETDGNINQYLRWANDFNGIGRSKIFPLANGPNTVKISITDSSNKAASSELIKAFQDYLDPGSTGLGNGKAPIGAKVTVVTGNIKTININANVVLVQGQSGVVGAEETIEEYFAKLTYKEDRVSYIGVASVILNLSSVYEVRSLTMNGSTSDILLSSEDIPTLGTLEIGVV